MRGKLIFITGGIRSGKSSWAERIVADMGQKVTYIATARVLDEEMGRRVELHRLHRPEGWLTIEEPLKVSQVVSKFSDKSDVIMIDCLTILLSNLMLEAENGGERVKSELQQDILDEITSLVHTSRDAKAHVVIVSNEVGMSLVSENFLGRQFQDLAGLANQIVAGMADEAYFVVAGYPIDLKRGRGGK